MDPMGIDLIDFFQNHGSVMGIDPMGIGKSWIRHGKLDSGIPNLPGRHLEVGSQTSPVSSSWPTKIPTFRSGEV